MQRDTHEISEGWEIFWGVAVIAVIFGMAYTSGLRGEMGRREYQGKTWQILCDNPPILQRYNMTTAGSLKSEIVPWEHMTAAQHADLHSYCATESE